MIIIATPLQKLQKNSYLFFQEVTIAISSKTRWEYFYLIFLPRFEYSWEV